MRKVLFKKWVPRQLDGSCKIIPNTGCFEDDYTIEGVFHQWGVGYEHFDIGIGNYSVAIVELHDGTMAEVYPQNIKFIS